MVGAAYIEQNRAILVRRFEVLQANSVFRTGTGDPWLIAQIKIVDCSERLEIHLYQNTFGA